MKQLFSAFSPNLTATRFSIGTPTDDPERLFRVEARPSGVFGAIATAIGLAGRIELEARVDRISLRRHSAGSDERLIIPVKAVSSVSGGVGRSKAYLVLAAFVFLVSFAAFPLGPIAGALLALLFVVGYILSKRLVFNVSSGGEVIPLRFKKATLGSERFDDETLIEMVESVLAARTLS